MKIFSYFFFMLFSTQLLAKDVIDVVGVLNTRTTPYTLKVHVGNSNEQVIWIEGLKIEDAVIYDGVYVRIVGTRDKSIPHALLKPKTIRAATADEIDESLL